MESRLLPELIHFNGNYSERLTSGNLHEDNVAQQLKLLAMQSRYQIGYIFCPSNHREHGRLISSQLTAVQSTGRLFTDTFEITSLQLVCRNLTLALDGLFDGLFVFKAGELELLKKKLQKTSTIIIFSNDLQEAKLVSDTIKDLAEPKTPPFFILASSKDNEFDISIDANIIAKVKTSIDSRVDAFNFWKQIRDHIDTLAAISPTKQVKKNSRCLMM